MPSTIPYDFGEVVLVGFPFTNLQSRKQRPAIVLSHSRYQQNRPDIILIAVTSQVKQPLSFGEYLIQDWQSAGLLKSSILKPLIATLEQSQVIKSIGHLSQRDLQGLQNTLQTILGS